MSDEQNGHGLSRLDRFEEVLNHLAAYHREFGEQHKLLMDRLARGPGNTDLGGKEPTE